MHAFVVPASAGIVISQAFRPQAGGYGWNARLITIPAKAGTTNEGEFDFMCLAIPGKVVEIVDEEKQLAKVEVGGVRRDVNIGLLDRNEIAIGDYVLIHVGFAMSKVDEREAEETLQLLSELGEMQAEMEAMRDSGKT